MARRGQHEVTIAVLGGAGAMGRITVRDLVETAPPEVTILVADHNEQAARLLARGLGRRVRAAGVDATQVAGTARALRGAFAVINCCQHQLNLPVMEAALRAGAHYCDLGGLFHATLEQLKLHARFRRAGLLAVPGIGAAPGVVNVMARAAADEMERVDEIHVLVGNVDRTRGREPGILGASYSIQTILDEASLPAAVFTGGKLAFVEPMSDPRAVQFPPPVGLRYPARTLHSEVATLPLSYRAKGVREVSFRIAFPDALADRLRFLRALGMTSSTAIRVGRGQVVPRDVLTALHGRLPKPAPGGPADEHEVLRVVVRGARGGEEWEEVIDCHTAGIRPWGIGIDADTGCPPSIAAQLLLAGVVTARGVVPPEQAIPAAPFFEELERRGMRIHRRRETWRAPRGAHHRLGRRSGRGAVSERYPPSPAGISHRRARRK